MSIYLDHAATSPLRQEALTALINQLKEVGNPSSLHTFGRDTRKALEEAREKIAKFVSAAPSEIIFTSSGTESNNLAIKGLFWKSNRKLLWFQQLSITQCLTRQSGWPKKKAPK